MTRIALPLEAVAGEDPGMRQLLELFSGVAGLQGSELCVRWQHGRHHCSIATGITEGRTVDLDLEIDDATTATLTVAAGNEPAPHALELFAEAIERELECRRYKAESELLQSAANSADAAILIFGDSTEILFANTLADELMSRQTEEELTVRWEGADPQPLFRWLMDRINDLLVSGATSSWKEEIAQSDGSELSCEISPLRTPEARSGRAVMIVLREIAQSPTKKVRDFARIHHLSPREHEVLRLLVGGFDTPKLASRLGISPHTVRDHLKNVFRKTSTRSRSELLSALSGAEVPLQR